MSALRPKTRVPFPEAVPLTTRYRVKARLGLKPLLVCNVCEAAIPFHPGQYQPGADLLAFKEQHDGCTQEQEQTT